MYIAALFTIARTWKQHRCLSADEWTKKLCYIYMGFPGSSDSKESPYSAGDLGSIPGPGGSPGEGNSNPLQYSCLENPMDRGAWWATVHGVAKSRTWLSNFASLHWLHCWPHNLLDCICNIISSGPGKWDSGLVCFPDAPYGVVLVKNQRFSPDLRTSHSVTDRARV